MVEIVDMFNDEIRLAYCDRRRKVKFRRKQTRNKESGSESDW